MAVHNEIEFERELAEYLADRGWFYSPNDGGYDRERAVFPEDILGWLAETQSEQLAKVVKSGSGDAAKQQDQLLDRIVKVLDIPLDNGGGTLNLLRKGFSHLAAKFEMCVFKPESTLNAKRNADYDAVRLRVMRQVHFSTCDNRSVDLVFFINGLPVATAELKTDFTQTITDAIAQYRTTRLPKDPATGKIQPLFVSGARALVHFAVTEAEVWMTTALAGDKTHFLPFNRGAEDGGPGNPQNPEGARSAYLWERVLQRDAWLNIFGRLMYIKHESSTDPISGKTTKSALLRFPRFHQWEVVTKLTAAVTAEGVGKRYLIQHSAGSGKTDSIAWTAHRMARLQVDNQKVFDSVIVVTDRNVLDAQLQDAIKQIDNDAGIVVAIDRSEIAKAGDEVKSKAGLLAQALTGGKLIVVVTLQTFPHAMDAIRKNKGLRGKTFAVIADEAHSSQSGQTANRLKEVLTADEQADLEDGGEIDAEAVLAAEMTERAESTNISYFAFTATPKAKTLELFGREPAGGGLPAPFHVYTMKQAIAEGYILDVLTGYHSFKLAFQIAQNAAAENEVDQSQATKEVMRWVKLNPQTITQKAAIIIEHFRENVAHLLDGHAKAMVVTDSRKAAVRYKKAIDDEVKRKGYGYGTLVAFSGVVRDPESGPEDFTEATMNPGVHDLRTAFRGDQYRVMIVANKFQTGFDQPLLCAMYVDRRLPNITAVQTLSRLNRTYRTPSGIQKTSGLTQVVDFVNEPAAIQEAFEPYYVDAHLETATNPNLVHDLSTKLDTAGIYTTAEIDACFEAASRGEHGKLSASVEYGRKRFADRYQSALLDNGGEGDKVALAKLDMFRKDVGSFVRLYDFMSQVINYGDTALEKKHRYLRLLEPEIRPENYTAPIDLSDVVLKQVKQVDRGRVDIGLGTRIGLIGMTAVGSGEKRDPKMVAFQQVLDRLNDLFGSEDFTESQKVSFLEALLRTLLDDAALVQQAKVNSTKQFVDSPDFDDAVTGAVADNQGAHEKMSDYFFTNAPGRTHLISDIAKWFYQVVVEQDDKAGLS
ncbi:hypothetical protein MANY_38280 [Mycolicibacterium anyangense]|uniref:Helicase ATP-binding domain-containing protein n=1 Tax=Mycolicibacterium anyangense TaxID=1431246 RepID=A0A6N4WH11_9MYCO|nr:type I restriction endonuclease [Mycolicibacterium anyangense]BBZ78491.1 hypothetical protein MANY_38280 [Mycolicibacterium anyangense]